MGIASPNSDKTDIAEAEFRKIAEMSPEHFRRKECINVSEEALAILGG